LFFNVLGVKAIKKTDKDFDALDEEVLSTIDIQVAKDILERKKLLKINNTYFCFLIE